MHVVVAEIRMKPEYRERFMEEMIADAAGSMEHEPGCFQFAVVQDEKDPNHIFLFEVYRDKEAFEAHMGMPHYIKWRDAVADWYAAPVVVTVGPNAYPGDEAWSK
jgi:quinol monooxygenase YgiN